MDHKRFNQLVDERTEWCYATLIKKDEEYSASGDRLHNFKVACRFDRDPRETALESLWGMLRKHIVSLVDMIEDSKQGKIISKAMLDEKIGDFINYGHLMEGLFVEANEENATKKEHIDAIQSSFADREKLKIEIDTLKETIKRQEKLISAMNFTNVANMMVKHTGIHRPEFIVDDKDIRREAMKQCRIL